MGIDTKETAVLNPSVGADGGQSIHTTESGITNCEPDCNDNFERLMRKTAKMNAPANLPTVTMQEPYETVYQVKPPIIDGLLYPGIYLLADAPKVGKPFFVAQIACHASTGRKLWEYDIHPGTVFYLALKDDYQIVSRLKQFTDKKNLCLPVVHHTCKTPAGDNFKMISGTMGLLGCADGAFILQKRNARTAPLHWT